MDRKQTYLPGPRSPRADNFFLSKDWKDGVSVLPAPLDIPCWLRLSANTGCNCKPCVLQNNKRITTAVLKTALFQNKLLYDEC